MSDDDLPALFTAWGTPVRVHPMVLANVATLWALLSWLAGRRHPAWRVGRRLLAGAASALSLLSADIGHAVAHIVSARWAEAPMDHVLISAGMPRTVYTDEQVSPLAHRRRALGGPLLNAAGFLVSLALRPLAPRSSVPREALDWSCLGHGALLVGSLAPLPLVDGGSLLKWSLVEAGHSPQQADTVVRQAGLGLAAGAAAAGLALAARGRWLPALGLLAAATFAVAASLDKIR
jgi:hypothetical protein